MHVLEVPAGASVWLTAAARPRLAPHRWEVVVLCDGGGSRAVYGSQIGGLDLHQRVRLPPLAADGRLEIRAFHKADHGWADDELSLERETPSLLQLAFCDTARSGSHRHDVVLSFAFPGFEPVAREAPLAPARPDLLLRLAACALGPLPGRRS